MATGEESGQTRPGADGKVVTTPPVVEVTEGRSTVETVESLHGGLDIWFVKLDPSGRVTSTFLVFRELRPEYERPFTVSRTEGNRGAIAVYRLRHLATGKIYEFRDVAVSKTGTSGSGWVIEDQVGWKQIRDELEARMKTQLSPAIIGGH